MKYVLQESHTTRHTPLDTLHRTIGNHNYDQEAPHRSKEPEATPPEQHGEIRQQKTIHHIRHSIENKGRCLFQGSHDHWPKGHSSEGVARTWREHRGRGGRCSTWIHFMRDSQCEILSSCNLLFQKNRQFQRETIQTLKVARSHSFSFFLSIQSPHCLGPLVHSTAPAPATTSSSLQYPLH